MALQNEFDVQEFDNLNDMLEPQVSVSETKNYYSNETHKHEYKDNAFTIFWRSNAMMSIIPNQDKVLLKFMLGEGKDPKNNSYNKDSKTFFSIDKEELFGLVDKLNYIYKGMLAKKVLQPVMITHNYNNEIKTLSIAQSQKDPSQVYVTLKKDNNKYYIGMNPTDFKYFLFALKMILYEIYTGTRQGFRFDWIW